MRPKIYFFLLLLYLLHYVGDFVKCGYRKRSVKHLCIVLNIFASFPFIFIFRSRRRISQTQTKSKMYFSPQVTSRFRDDSLSSRASIFGTTMIGGAVSYFSGMILFFFYGFGSSSTYK